MYKEDLDSFWKVIVPGLKTYDNVKGKALVVAGTGVILLKLH